MIMESINCMFSCSHPEPIDKVIVDQRAYYDAMERKTRRWREDDEAVEWSRRCRRSRRSPARGAHCLTGSATKSFQAQSIRIEYRPPFDRDENHEFPDRST
jgi:hypothetical protein